MTSEAKAIHPIYAGYSVKWSELHANFQLTTSIHLVVNHSLSHTNANTSNLHILQAR